MVLHVVGASGLASALDLAAGTEIEAEVREAFPEETGMLVVSEVVREGASHNILNPGDVVRACDRLVLRVLWVAPCFPFDLSSSLLHARSFV